MSENASQLTETPKPGPKADPRLYPNPKPVLTGTVFGFDEKNPFRVVIVRLAKPEDPAKPFVLPGGIFDVGKGRHRSQRHVVEVEFQEEAGKFMHWVTNPVQFAISQRCDGDRRYWCSCPTVMGANDAICAGAVTGEIRPEDEEEVAGAFWADVREFDLDTVGRGHELLIEVWKVLNENGGLKRETLFDPKFQAAVTALSDDRWVVSVNELNGMIYLEDAEPVVDSRKPQGDWQPKA